VDEGITTMVDVPHELEGAWVPARRLEDLQEGKAQRLELRGVGVCILRSGSTVYAVEDRCPHRGARLSGGIVYDGCKVVCPDHGWTIDMSTGQVDPPETGRARRLGLTVRDGMVLVEVLR
jgi:nitrite reductase (NADH) small subunit